MPSPTTIYGFVNAKLCKKLRQELRQSIKTGALHTLLQLREISSFDYLQNQRTGQIVLDPNSVKGIYRKIKKGIKSGNIPDPRRTEAAPSS